jgi:hypothetical protein
VSGRTESVERWRQTQSASIPDSTWIDRRVLVQSAHCRQQSKEFFALVRFVDVTTNVLEVWSLEPVKQVGVIEMETVGGLSFLWFDHSRQADIWVSAPMGPGPQL